MHITSVSAGLEHKRSCLKCVCALATQIQDLLAFGCGEQGNCFTVHKCVHLSNGSFSMLKSGNTSQKLYVNRGATLQQRAGWNLSNLALGKCTISIGRNLLLVTPRSCIFTVSPSLGIVKKFRICFYVPRNKTLQHFLFKYEVGDWWEQTLPVMTVKFQYDVLNIRGMWSEMTWTTIPHF